MDPTRWLGLAFVALALAIVVKQSRAKSCPRHSRLAGVLAWVLALACTAGGVWLLLPR